MVSTAAGVLVVGGGGLASGNIPATAVGVPGGVLALAALIGVAATTRRPRLRGALDRPAAWAPSPHADWPSDCPGIFAADPGGNPVACGSPGSIRWAYVLMSSLPGVRLDTVWDQLSTADRDRLAGQLGQRIAALHQLPPTAIGGLVGLQGRQALLARPRSVSANRAPAQQGVADAWVSLVRPPGRLDRERQSPNSTGQIIVSRLQ